MRLQIAAALLFALNRFKQRLEVAFPEAPAALALNDLEEQGRPIFNRTREDLQHVAFIVAIDQDSKFFQFVDGLIDGARRGSAIPCSRCAERAGTRCLARAAL